MLRPESPLELRSFCEKQRVGWVERSDTYQLHLMEMMGFAGSTHPCTSVADAGRAVTRKQPVGQISVQPRSEKYFCSHSPQITSRTFRIPPHQRGVSRSSRTRGGMRWTRQRLARDGIAGRVGERPVSDHQASGREMLQRTAKSCGPDAPTLASSLAQLSRPNRA